MKNVLKISKIWQKYQKYLDFFNDSCRFFGIFKRILLYEFIQKNCLKICKNLGKIQLMFRLIFYNLYNFYNFFNELIVIYLIKNNFLKLEKNRKNVEKIDKIGKKLFNVKTIFPEFLEFLNEFLTVFSLL